VFMRLRALRKDERGFTLIEMMVVLAIIGLIAAFAVPNVMAALGRSRVRTVEAQAREIQAAMEEYYHDYIGYPPDPDTALYDYFFSSDDIGGLDEGYLYPYLSMPETQDEAMFEFVSYDNSNGSYTIKLKVRGVSSELRYIVITPESVEITDN